MRHVKAVILRVRGFEPPPLLLFRFRYGVVGNMSGFHPVASGSIPGIGLSIEKFLVLLAQLAEHPLNILAFLAQSAERCANNFSLVLGPRERFVWKRNGRRFDPGRKLSLFVLRPGSLVVKFSLRVQKARVRFSAGADTFLWRSW